MSLLALTLLIKIPVVSPKQAWVLTLALRNTFSLQSTSIRCSSVDILELLSV